MKSFFRHSIFFNSALLEQLRQYIWSLQRGTRKPTKTNLPGLAKAMFLNRMLSISPYFLNTLISFFFFVLTDKFPIKIVRFSLARRWSAVSGPGNCGGPK